MQGNSESVRLLVLSKKPYVTGLRSEHKPAPELGREYISPAALSPMPPILSPLKAFFHGWVFLLFAQFAFVPLSQGEADGHA